jgi:hypothetical protein
MTTQTSPHTGTGFVGQTSVVTPPPDLYALPDSERRRRLVEAIHAHLGHMSPQLPALLTEEELARVLRRSVGTLRNRRWAGLPLPRHVLVGRYPMYLPEDVADFILGIGPRLGDPLQAVDAPRS